MAKTYRRSDPVEPEPTGSGEDARVRRRPRGRTVANVAATALAVLLTLLLLVIIVLQTDWGREQLRGVALHELRALLAEDAELDIARIEGNVITGLRLIDAVVREGNEPVIEMDTLWVQYNLMTLFRQRFSASTVAAHGVRVWARQAPDGTWNLGRILRPPVEADPPPTAWVVELDDLWMRRAAIEARFHHPDRDSVLIASPIEFDMTDFYFDAEGVRLALDSLAMVAHPAVADGVPILAGARASLDTTRIDIAGLTLLSQRSDVRVAGWMEWEEIFTFDGDLRAEPLALADVRQFFDIPLHGTADVHLQAEGAPRDMVASLTANFVGHGRINVDAAYERMPDGPTRLAVDGRIDAFDPGQFLNNPELAGNLTGTVDFDLAGPALDEVSGPVEVRLAGSQLADQRIMRAELIGEFQTGRLSFDLTGAVPGATVQARGTTSPFADVIPYDVRGQVAGLDMAALLRDPEQELRIRRAEFDFQGRGLDPETLAARGRIAAEGVNVGDLQFATARVDGSLQAGNLNANAGLTLPDGGGALTAVGSAQLFAEPLVYEIQQGQAVNLNLAALTGNPEMSSDLTGTFTASGTGVEPETMRLSFAVRLVDSAYGRFTIAQADASGVLAAGELRIDADADLAEAGRLTALGTIRVFDDPITYDLTGTATNLNLAVLLDDPTQDSDLTGAYAVTGTGIDPQTMVASFRLDLQPSRYRAQEFLAGTLRGELIAGQLDATIDAVVPEGEIAFAITARPFDAVTTFGLREGTFSGVNLALLLDMPGLQTSLAGRAQVDFQGPDLETGAASGRIELDPSTINAAVVQSGVIDFSVTQGDATAVAALNFDRGEAGILFSGRPFDDIPTYSFDARLDSVDVLAVIGDQRGQSLVNMEVAVEGEGFDPETMVARANIRAEDSILPDAVIDSLRADVTLTRGLLVAETFELAADFADISAHGQVALFDEEAISDLFFSASVRDAGPINAFLEDELVLESADVEGRVRGPAGGPVAIDAGAIIRRAAYQEYGARRLDVRLNAEYFPGEEIPFEGKVRVRFDFLSLPTFIAREGDVSVTYIDEQVAADGIVSIDDFREVAFRTRFEAIDDPAGDFHTALLIDDLTLRIDDERWELLMPATLSLGDGRYLIRNFLLFSDDQQIAADGRIDVEGVQTLVITAETVRLDPFTDLIGYAGVGGILSTQLVFDGPAAAPEIAGTVTVADLTSRGEAVGSLAADLAFADNRLGIEALLTHVDGQTFVADGFIPLAFRLDGEPATIPPDAPVQLRLESEAFPISWAEPFLPPRMVEQIGGTLTTNVLVTGTEGNPQLEGEAILSEGRLQLEVTGAVVFQNILMALDFDGDTARLAQARVQDGRGGLLTATGTIRLPQLSVGELDLGLVMQNFRVIDTPTYRGLILSATPGQNLRFTGTITDPELDGNVTLVSGDIYLTDELIGPDLVEVELTAAEIQRIQETFAVRVVAADTARAGFMDALDLNVGIAIERNVWLRSRRNPRLDIEFFGNVEVVKPPATDFQLFGSVEVQRGRVELPTLAGRPFTIGTIDDTYGMVTFNGPVDETLIDLRAGMQAQAGVRGATAAVVYVNYSGRLAEDPEFVLTSDPFMETSDIACVIATGRPCGEAFQGRIAEEIALAQLGSIVEGVAAQQLGLDVVEVHQRATGEIVVTFGAYVTDRVYAAVSQPVIETRSVVDETATRTPEVLIEYEMLRWLMLRAERRNIGGVGGALLFQFDY